jgi:hypothetical protein
VLSQLNVNFKTEFSPDWIKPKRYDFYFELNNQKYIVEMDGGIGHGIHIIDKQRFSVEETLVNDEYKDELAYAHSIFMIRIICEPSDFQIIKNNITNSKLNEIFDLSIVDWLKSDSFATSNLVKEICTYKKFNPVCKNYELSDIFKIGKTTISKYLKIGKRLDWC